MRHLEGTPASIIPFEQPPLEQGRFFDRHPALQRLVAVGAAVATLAVAAACGRGSETGTPTAQESGISTVAPEKAETPKYTYPEFSAKATWELSFSGMEDGTAISPDVLRPNLLPAVPTWNQEAQAYTDRPENMQVRRGALVITARKENKPYRYPDEEEGRSYKYTSARLESYNSETGEALPNGLPPFEYGLVEATVQVPEGQGVFAAPLWLLSVNSPKASKVVNAEMAKLPDNLSQEERDEKESELWGKWYLLDGELDIESYGKPNQVEFTSHNMTTPPDGDGKLVTVKGATTGFHTYAIGVSPDKVTWFVDGVAKRTIKKTSNDPKKWAYGGGNLLGFVSNLAMGGTGGGKIDNSKGPWKMPVQQFSFFPHEGDKN